MPAPSAVFPSYLSFLTAARELTVGTAILGTSTIPLDPGSYEPEDTPHFLPDEAIRGSMVHLYNEILGVEDATFTYGGPVYLDNDGFFFDNVFGDMSTTGSATVNGGTSTTFSQASLIGAVSATVATTLNFAGGQNVQIGTGSVAEVVVLSSTAASNVLNFVNYPLRFAHPSSSTVFTVTGNYTHTFNALNTGTGQPPTHTLVDYSGIPAGTGARAYVSSCVASLDFTGNAEQLLAWKVTGSSWISSIAATKPTAQSAYVVPIPNWRGAVTIGGGTVFNIGEWSISLKRPLKIYWTAQNSQNPYFIARGPLDCVGTLNYTVATDETPLTLMLNNTQPQVNIAINNGSVATNTGYLSFNFNSAQSAYVKSKVMRNAELVAFQTEFQSVANVNNTGGSGGLGPATVTIVNNTPSY